MSVDLTLSIAVLTLVSSGSLLQHIRRLSKTCYRQMSSHAYVWHTEVQIESSISIFSWFHLEILCMLFAKYEVGCHLTIKTDSFFLLQQYLLSEYTKSYTMDLKLLSYYCVCVICMHVSMCIGVCR